MTNGDLLLWLLCITLSPLIVYLVAYPIKLFLVNIILRPKTNNV